MNQSEAGHLGGISTSCRYGLERCPTCGHITENRFHAENGRKGGQIGGKVVVRKYGREHMSEIGKLGGRGNKGEKHATG
jgi:hypothetical protein